MNPTWLHMIRLQHPALLLLLVPIALVALWMARPGRAGALAYSSADLIRDAGTTRRTRWGRFVPALRWLGASLLVVALARPVIEHRNAQVDASGVDIMLAIDVSGSMEARDMTSATAPSEQASRLDAAKAEVARFVEARPNDRVGLVAFAGEPFLASPLTLDHDWVLQSLSRIESGQVDDGTAIGSAIAAGVRRLDAGGAKSKVLIVLTDGQNNAGKIQPSAAAEAARALGVKVYTIGVGSTGDALVPITDEHGKKELVTARVDVDEASMRQIAETTGAKFFRATDSQSLADVYATIDGLEKTTRTIKSFTQREERFGWFASAGLLLVLTELGLSATRFRRVP